MDSFREHTHLEAVASSALVAAERALALVAPHDAPVLLVGEPGSGRSVFARRLHQASLRGGGAWIQVDCRGLSTRSSPVKALEDAIASAATGSILFEDIDVLTAPLQVRLMVWLEASRGAPRSRLLATTRRDLEDEVRRGTFREDLRSRVDVFQIRVPPLRERQDDIPALARQLVAESAARLHVAAPFLPLDVEQLLVGYPWPGNVRELRNAMERAVALSSGSFIEATSLPPRILAEATSPTIPGMPST
jgi:DNA-binding NtrC family response regulator